MSRHERFHCRELPRGRCGRPIRRVRARPKPDESVISRFLTRDCRYIVDLASRSAEEGGTRAVCPVRQAEAVSCTEDETGPGGPGRVGMTDVANDESMAVIDGQRARP